jgi:sterol desaturase/sphingolipid hydroxylase (fatty acid hydroxylase superfamily)
MSLFEQLISVFKPIEDQLVSPVSALSIYSLGFSFALAFAFLAFRQKQRRGRFRLRAIAQAMFRRRVIFHRSTFADFGYFSLGLIGLGAFLGWALFSASAIGDAVAGFLDTHFGARAPINAPEFLLRAGKTLLLFLAYELGFFVDHSLKHRVPALWALHKTHHSAEVLTPLTNFRVHPLDSLILANNLALVVGFFSGIAKYAIGNQIQVFAFDGMNVLMVLYIYLTAQLQHSQYWIPMRGALGRIFMSPAHHQLHHSIDPKHFNRNMGASLAIWDWLFGTLEIPEKESPKLSFGAAAEDRDPHSVTTLLLDPVINALSAVIGVRLPLAPTGSAPAKHETAPPA